MALLKMFMHDKFDSIYDSLFNNNNNNNNFLFRTFVYIHNKNIIIRNTYINLSRLKKMLK